jgi:prepilin signal peptidase PulO-like enzyme (type II secretory pathway)
MIEHMEYAVMIGILAVFGMLFGSFAGASVWRLRARQLVADKREGEPVDEAEYRRLVSLTKDTFTKDRSRCLHCGHELRWYDLLPLVSWLQLGGKCRYCRQPIGVFEPLMEVAMALFFAVSYIWWPAPLDSALEVMQFGLWLVAGVGLAILFAYDQKWFLLPDVVTFSLVAVAGVFALIEVAQAPNHLTAAWSVAAAVAVLSGLYLALWRVSKGRWVGFGDVKLGLVLALLLADWKLAFVALFTASLLGCLVVLPGLATRTLSRTARVPFGPFLILGAIIAFFAGDAILAWYLGLSY